MYYLQPLDKRESVVEPLRHRCGAGLCCLTPSRLPLALSLRAPKAALEARGLHLGLCQVTPDLYGVSEGRLQGRIQEVAILSFGDIRWL